ncbi:PilC/PilY family type IV pilus protein [Acinetobacter tibetensis]|uniref:PilC/PilY family type IV pilus protein n=1 Tax=Acinetobacter tibetensis TaxID=2943497 RepID=A0AAE9S0Q4_9GAMM|nr:PilC/PilY family type IV pilus protein [Acinetobacter tibetensis]USE83528.1 PilC/PilY family type IV pilus protein [Acinetobacter tibetensis]
MTRLNNKIMLQKYCKKVLATSLSALCSGLVISSSVQASDIDIYQQAKSGTISLMMMLDISGSMGYPQLVGSRSACDVPSGATIESNGSDTSTNGTPTYKRSYCNVIETKTYRYRSYRSNKTTYYQSCTNAATSISACSWGNATTSTPSLSGLNNESSSSYTYYYEGMTRKYYDRITRLKDGMFDLLYGNTTKGITRIDDDKVIGLSTFSRPTSFNSSGEPTAADNVSGQVRIPARRLDAVVNGVTQRQILLNEIAKLGARGGTPTADAYADTAAYLFGTTTGGTEKGIIGYTTTTYPNRFYSCVTPTLTGGCNGYSSSYTTTIPAYDTLTLNNGYYYYYKNNIASSASSGFYYSYDETKNAAKTLYAKPASLTQADDIKKCSGQGIYVLTDGQPNNNDSAKLLMQTALTSTYSSTLSCTDSDSGWECMHNFVQNLLTPTKNPLGLKIKTAVVGFGQDFNGVASYDKNKTQEENIAALGTIDTDVKKAAYWGIIGEGGWYSGSESEDVVNSVNDFISSLGSTIPAVTTGSPTVPKDSLNPSVLQQVAYYPQFQPTPDKTYQLWAGNLKKYNVVAGVLKDKGGSSIVDSDGRLVDNYDLWAPAVDAAVKDSDESIYGSTKYALMGGMKSQLKLRTDANTENRKLLTNRVAEGTGASAVFVNSTSLRQVKISDLTDSTYQNDANRGYLISLLGYGIDATNPSAINLATAPELRQVGAVMHSSPILLTNKGKITYTDNVLGSINREDYVLFGTTQGLLHVVDAVTGKEKFAFVPNEMVENQKQAFLKYDSTSGGLSKLFYGVDAPWATYTEYVVDANGNLTVGTGRNSQKGKQIAYGGLRMGGRSYYALDLANINDPKLLFQISPSDQKVYYNGSSKTFSQLQYMGQSWSKPAIAWVKWGKSRKRVMFVGGGYDAGGDDGDAHTNGVKGAYAGYESDTYNQTNAKGGGVYMFDADNGDLLWWASKNATTSSATTNTGVIGLNDDNLKYSVTSEIRTEDRNSDGLVDHLYFGDLGGQLFRIDLDNSAATLGAFAKTPHRLLNLNASEKSPRFYEMPGFSIYDYAGKAFAVISIGTGNRSLPLKDYTVGTTGYDYDAVYNIYDKDVTRKDLYTTTTFTKTLVKADLGEITQDNRNDDTTLVAPYTAYGWFYRFKSSGSAAKLQSAKVLATPIVLNSRMFVSTFDGSKPGLSGDCGAGVKGESFLQQFCMPYGQCAKAIAIECTSADGCSEGPGIQTPAVVDEECNPAIEDCTKCDPSVEKCDPDPNCDPSVENCGGGGVTNNLNYCISTGNRGVTKIGGIISAGSSKICLVPQRWYELSGLKQ